MLHAECFIPEGIGISFSLLRRRGTELVHSYGELSSAELLATYGFLPSEDLESPHEAGIDKPFEVLRSRCT